MTSIFQPDVPGGAYDLFVADAATTAATRRAWNPSDGPLPALYPSHGAPPLLDDGAWMRELFDWAHQLPQPRAILIVSAHWEAAPLSLSSSAAATTPVYDFGGFAPRYYSMRYDTPDAADFARQVRAVLPDHEPVHEHRSRGLDHGAWVPLMVMYPNADIPVLQLSLPTHDPARLLAPGMPYAHPTVEHFIPLFVTLGAATDPEAPVQPRIDGYWVGLARTSFQTA